MKTIEELANLNEAQYRGIKSIADLLGVPPKDESISAVTKAVESLLGTVAQLREGNENLKASWDREIVARTKAEADQPAADVPTWRPIAELPDDEREYVYWDGDEMSWHGNPQEKVDATHFIAPPPKPDPFEAWWKASGYVAEKETARQSWNAAREAKA